MKTVINSLLYRDNSFVPSNQQAIVRDIIFPEQVIILNIIQEIQINFIDSVNEISFGNPVNLKTAFFLEKVDNRTDFTRGRNTVTVNNINPVFGSTSLSDGLISGMNADFRKTYTGSSVYRLGFTIPDTFGIGFGNVIAGYANTLGITVSPSNVGIDYTIGVQIDYIFLSDLSNS